MQVTSEKSTSFRTIKSAVISYKRTIIPDDIMEKKLIAYEKKIESGKDFDLPLFNCTFELKSLDTIQPLINSKLIERIFSEFDTFTDQQKAKVLSILLVVSTIPYQNVIASKNLEDLMKVLKAMYNENNQERILMILKEYFEIDEFVTEKILKLGGMDIVMDSCKSKKVEVLSHCSLLILQIILYGGKNSVQILMKNELSSWVLPFAHIFEDPRINYFAYFSLIYLRSIHKIHHEFFEYGLMDNIVQWLSENEIKLRGSASFNCKDTNKLYQKLLAMLISKNRMAQTFGTFQICCELTSNSEGFMIFNDEDIVRALRRIAVYSNAITSKFAINALIILANIPDNRIQRFPPKNISEWTDEDVQKWLKIFGFQEYALFFLKVDGEALMKISENELKSKYFMADSTKRKSFLDERSILAGVSNIKAVKSLQEESVWYQNDTTLNNGLSITSDQKSAIIDSPFQNPTKHKFDAFISYRRQGGADLASLIFIYLKGKKYKTFFDVQTLRAGRFADKLKRSIQQSKNFILLLTSDALDRCKDEGDWITAEIEMALKSGCTIIPITKDFDNSTFDNDSLPESIKKIKEFNQISWHHDTQDSCLGKILEYMEERNASMCPHIFERK